jgi:hypothetical protein
LASASCPPIEEVSADEDGNLTLLEDAEKRFVVLKGAIRGKK